MSKKEIFIDLETTGLSPNHDRICQIGILMPDGTEFDSLINPEIPINPATTAIHGIDNEMVKDAPKFIDLADQIIASLNDADIFVAYNYVFDFQFLQNELFRTKKYILNEEEFAFIDPYKIFRKMFPHNLSNAYKFYTGKEFENAHSAIADIKATREVLEKQKELYSELFEKDPKEIEQITIGDTSIIGKWFSKNGDGYKFKQGKHKGEKINLEHKNYLKWIESLEDTTISEKRVIASIIN